MDEAEEGAPPKKDHRRRRQFAFAVAGLYLSTTVVTAVLLGFFVDRFWVATLIAFFPRWALALAAPLPLLIALWDRNLRAIGMVLLSLALQVFFVGNLRLSHCASVPREKTLRVMSQNADAMPMDQPIRGGGPWLAAVVAKEDLDVVLIQECRVADNAVLNPVDGFYFTAAAGTCILSRYPITKVDPRPREDFWERGAGGSIVLYEVAAPSGTVSILDVHLPTPRDAIGGFKKFHLGGIKMMNESTELRAWASGVAREWAKRATGPLIVAGDFNTPPESQLFKEVWRSSYASAFDACGTGFGLSKETVSHGVEFGTRIDHVLFDSSWTCSGSHLGPEVGSDHRGMIAELSLR